MRREIKSTKYYSIGRTLDRQERKETLLSVSMTMTKECGMRRQACHESPAADLSRSAVVGGALRPALVSALRLSPTTTEYGVQAIGKNTRKVVCPHLVADFKSRPPSFCSFLVFYSLFDCFGSPQSTSTATRSTACRVHDSCTMSKSMRSAVRCLSILLYIYVYLTQHLPTYYS